MKDVKEFGEYTHWSRRKTFKEEKEMVINGMEDQEDEEIRKYLTPLVEYWGRGFKKHSKIKLNDEDFYKAGFMHLNFALRNYYEKLNKGKVGFKFSTYFEWFIRQGIVEYLKVLDKK